MAHGLGYRYRLHVRALPGALDLVFPRLRKIIVVNGCFWHLHGCPRCRVPSSRKRYWNAKLRRNAERDKRIVHEMRRLGWRVLVVWECQTTPSNRESLRRRIDKFLSNRRAVVL